MSYWDYGGCIWIKHSTWCSCVLEIAFAVVQVRFTSGVSHSLQCHHTPNVMDVNANRIAFHWKMKIDFKKDPKDNAGAESGL